MKLNSFYFTNRGGRGENEDCAGSLEGAQGGIYVVADGLGGHMHGSRASKCVTKTLLEAWEKSAPAESELAVWLESGIDEANRNLLQMQEESRSNMKSTVVALAISGGSAVWANTGDSRLYYIHDDRLWKVTEDHSVAYKKYKSGEITRAQIATDEDQSSLLKALGNSRRWEPQMYSAPLQPGDAFMLCSDGMWEYLSDEEIVVDCLKSSDARDWAELLLMRVVDRVMPGNDNLTVLTVKVN